MADNGALYRVYSDEMARGMTGVRRGRPDRSQHDRGRDAAGLLLTGRAPTRPARLSGCSATFAPCHGAQAGGADGRVVRTFQVGAACYDRETKELHYAFSEKISGMYHGTGMWFPTCSLPA